MSGREEWGRFTAAAPTGRGWVYFSGGLTPYDVESFCEHVACLWRSDGEIRVELDVSGEPHADRSGLHALTRRMRRLARGGVTVRIRTTRAARRQSTRRR